jgi:galactokinase
VEIATATPGVVASRMTGAGFGGCTVSLVAKGSEESLRDRVLREYPSRTKLTPMVYVAAVVDGAGEIDLTGMAL